MKRKPNQDDPEQSKLFIEKARELGADGQAEAADEIMGNLAKRPPEPRPPLKRKRKIKSELS